MPKSKTARTPSQPTFPRKIVAPRSGQFHLLDRSRVAWQDYQGTWHGERTSATRVYGAALAGLHATVVTDEASGEAYLWIGIGAPDTMEARICYAVVAGDDLRAAAERILRCVPATAKRGAR